MNQMIWKHTETESDPETENFEIHSDPISFCQIMFMKVSCTNCVIELEVYTVRQGKWLNQDVLICITL